MSVSLLAEAPTPSPAPGTSEVFNKYLINKMFNKEINVTYPGQITRYPGLKDLQRSCLFFIHIWALTVSHLSFQRNKKAETK